MHTPDDRNRQVVESMAGFGVPEVDIGKAIGISNHTLRKYYSQQLIDGRVNANSRVAKSLYEKALGDGTGSVTACIFWLKCRAGWVEPRAPWEQGPGKKEQMQEAATKAGGAGTGWADDLEVKQVN